LKVIVSEFNKVEGNRYFDSESQTSFEIDHTTQVSEDDPDKTTIALKAYYLHCKDRLKCAVIAFGITECRSDVSMKSIDQTAAVPANRGP
jgi:hypothetical protein